MSVLSYLARARQRTLDRVPHASDWRNVYFSGTTLAFWRAAAPLTRGSAQGLVLDAGSGRGGWASVIAENGAERESVDLEQRAGESLTWTADLMNMPDVPDGRYDCVVCHQVLEHVPRPWDALAELHRVLKPGGVLVVSAPHLSRLHELPNDYFRYTPAGMTALLEHCCYQRIRVTPYGGVFGFLHHQLATVVLGLAAISWPLYTCVLALSAPIAMLAAGLDRLLTRAGHFPAGVVAVARKPQ